MYLVDRGRRNRRRPKAPPEGHTTWLAWRHLPCKPQGAGGHRTAPSALRWQVQRHVEMVVLPRALIHGGFRCPTSPGSRWRAACSQETESMLATTACLRALKGYELLETLNSCQRTRPPLGVAASKSADPRKGRACRNRQASGLARVLLERRSSWHSSCVRLASCCSRSCSNIARIRSSCRTASAMTFKTAASSSLSQVPPSSAS